MKALGYGMFVDEFPDLEVEQSVGLRYKPDLVARDRERDGILFWGECGQVTMRKVAWLLKHGRVERLVLFKIMHNPIPLVAELRASVDRRQLRPGRLKIVNFVSDIVGLTATRRIAAVPQTWYTTVSL